MNVYLLPIIDLDLPLISKKSFMSQKKKANIVSIHCFNLGKKKIVPQVLEEQGIDK